ncbi:MAG: Ig-like domain-containing protein [Lachnospiraceae bacterium]|nr:Ig-like domain-containing protein [Lachnospiraceae bacterium]
MNSEATKIRKKAVSKWLAVMLVASLVLAVSIPTEAASMKLSKTKLTLAVGQSKKLKVNTKKKIKWKSSAPSVVSVNKKGKVTAKKKGKAVVTAVVAGKKMRCKITVKKNTNKSKNKKAVVAYFAYSENIGDTSSMSVDAVTSASLNEKTKNKQGNLQLMAKEIQKKKGADIHKILVKDTYNPDYSTMVERAEQEGEENSKPALKSKVKNIQQYDVIYLGMPVWFGSLPRPVATFLDENDLSGKTIVPFGIHLGSGFGSNISEIKKKYPDANVVKGFTISADTANATVKKKFDSWLDKLTLK